MVTGVSIDDTVLSVARGENHTFTADVKGTVADKTVTWSVEGATSAKTTIDSTTGKLTIGSDETAATLTVKATAKTLRIPPRKARLVLDLIRGKDVEEAAAILRFTPNFAADATLKVLKSAIANAVNNNGLDESKLYVKACYANEGFILKRFMPRAKGSASAIHKRTSHITVVVSERA